MSHADHARDVARSRHQGTPGQRLTVTATVAAVHPQRGRLFGNRAIPQTMIKLRDDAGHVYLWWAKTTRTPAADQRVTLCGTVSHAEHDGVRQTHLTRVRWNPADP